MEEEEYAWLPVEFLKPFRPGDTTGNPEGPASTDVTLQACVEAATKAVLDREKLEAQANSLQMNGYQTDSDGGECQGLKHSPLHPITWRGFCCLLIAAEA